LTGTELATRIRFLTKTNSTTFTDAEMLPLVNNFMTDEIASRIVETDSQHFAVPYTFNLVANQREYAIGDDVLNRAHKLEVKFVSTDDRMPAEYIKDYRGSEEEDQITANFNNSEGGFAYTIRRRAILILSGTIIAVTNGARMVSIVYPEKLANLTGTTGLEVDPSTTTFGFPRQFHELLARRVSIAWKGSQPKPIPLSPDERKYEADLAKALAAIAMVTDEGSVRSEDPGVLDTGDDGFDY
jgi:hypothetical protein